jgi:50S ribosomal subunit-associated GTPase HflX
MNKLCNAGVEVDDRLFSTLSTTTRRVSEIKANILMSDTVGFIRDLPPDLVNAFNSTLEEIFDADLILLIFDASEPKEVIRSKLSTSLKILLPKIESGSIVVIGNKVDLLSSQESRADITALVKPITQPYDLILISSVTGEGLSLLKERILRVQGHTFVIVAEMPLTDAVYGLLSRIRSSSEVSMNVVDRHAAVVVRCKPEDSERIVGWLNAAGATRITTNVESPEMPPERETPSSGNEGAPL